MKCAIIQPSYIPWRGYFHQIQKSDVFVFLDEVQYDKHGWRNRNRIKTKDGSIWLTIPVLAKGNVEKHIPINEIKINWQANWSRKHLMTLQQTYGKAPYFSLYRGWLEEHYARHDEFLSDFTIDFTVALAQSLGITDTRFVRSSEVARSSEIVGPSEIDSSTGKVGRILTLLRSIGADHYISGPSARSYIDVRAFDEAGITIEYMEYDYPEYPQLFPPHDPQLSVLDLMFMTGADAGNYIWKT